MKRTIFTDIIINWKKYSDKQKIARLQDLENMIARWQGIKPKTVTNKYDRELMKAIGNGRDADGCYDRTTDKIYVLNLNRVPSPDPINQIKLIIHENFHAYIYEYLKGNVPTLRLYSGVDREKFLIEEENIAAIKTYFANGDERFPMKEGGFMPLFDSFNAEEKLNYQEDSMYVMKLIMDSIQSMGDARCLIPQFIDSITYEAENVKRGKKYENLFGKTYDEMVVEALNSEELNKLEKVDVSKCGQIKNQIDPEILELYNKVYQIYTNFVTSSDSPIISNSARDKLLQDTSLQIESEYYEFVYNMLKNKRKD